MKIQRLFTKTPGKPYEGIEWENRKAEIREASGKKVFSGEAYVPSFWSQSAVDILAQKYFRKKGVPTHTKPVEEAGIPEELQRRVPDPEGANYRMEELKFGGELSAKQTFRRLAGCWAYWGLKYGYFDDTESALAFFDECQYMLAKQLGAPNSPQWFNTGLYWAYGIEGPAQGHYYTDPKSGILQKSDNAYEHPQPHACFILNVEDSLVKEDGILDLLNEEARIFKYGSGSGSNFSKLRAEGEPLSGGGKSSGMMSFLKVFDRNAGAIKSGGTTRRAAKMVVVDDDHPDVLKFINWKVEEEQKVAALALGTKLLNQCQKKIHEAAETFVFDGKDHDRWNPKINSKLAGVINDYIELGAPASFIKKIIQAGSLGDPLQEIEVLDTGWTSKAYETVAGQNANNSVRLRNKFMEAVERDWDWNLYYRTDLTKVAAGESVKPAYTIKAREIWKAIAKAAWACADPGIQFHDTINEWHTCPRDGEIRASNPCSEYMFLDDTACNLASLRLVSFYDPETGLIDLEAYRHAVHLWTIILEISVLMAQYPSADVAKKSYEYRTLGLGFADLGALLMQMAIPYDSEEGRNIGASLMAILHGQSILTSSLLAKDKGPFPAYEQNSADTLRVIYNHARACWKKQWVQTPEWSNYKGLTIEPQELDSEHCPEYLVEEARNTTYEAYKSAQKYGVRNAQWTVLAPTGTISFVMDCDTTSSEPDYALVKSKSLAGGGMMKIINQSVPKALKKLQYSPEQIQAILTYCTGHNQFPQEHFGAVIDVSDLRKAGLDDDEIQDLQKKAKTAFDINHILPLKVRHYIEAAQESTYSNIMEETNKYVCGTMTIEGAPFLQEQDYPIFDCANKCGRYGTRYISTDGHVRMMAALQPFISGAISKTINMPANATVEEVAEVYKISHRMMLKAIALYRDGSKLSQPLNAVSEFGLEEFSRKKIPSTTPTTPSRIRSRLASRRTGYTQKAKVVGHSIYIRTGEYPDGSLGEIFLTASKAGAPFAGMMNCFAVAVSLGLQYGVPLEEYVSAFVGTKFEPAGMVSENDHIKMCTSIVDYVFRELGITYLDQHNLAHVMSEEQSSDMPSEEQTDWVSRRLNPLGRRSTLAVEKRSGIVKNGGPSKAETAKTQGYEGEPCPECSNWTLVRNGTCMKCDTCGTTTGCS